MMLKIKPISEADFQAQVIALARLLGYRVAHFRRVCVQRANGSTYFETPVAADGAGFPDLCLVGRGRVIFAELKTDRGVVSADQTRWLKALDDAGQEWHIWRPRDWETIRKTLERSAA